jgi:hypothetical protein
MNQCPKIHMLFFNMGKARTFPFREGERGKKYKPELREDTFRVVNIYISQGRGSTATLSQISRSERKHSAYTMNFYHFI